MATAEYALLISGLAALAAIFAGLEARKAASKAAETALIAQEQANQLQALDWTTQYFADVRRWGDEVTDAISAAIHLFYIVDKQQRASDWNNVRARLSALADRGRWYFPNDLERQYGLEKPPAYRGRRREILDHIVDAYDAVPMAPGFYEIGGDNNDSTTSDSYDVLVRCQRAFVSEVQTVLNPRHREEQRKVVEQHFDLSDKMNDGN